MKCKTEKEKTKGKNAYALSIGILDRLQQEKIESLMSKPHILWYDRGEK